MATHDSNNQRLARDLSCRAEDVGSYPAVMYVEASRGCPFACIMCNVPERFGRQSRDMPRALLDKLGPYFKHLELLAIHGDGEPLLSRDIDFFIRTSIENDCFLHMNTTGFALDRRLADRLCAAKLSVRFSIHAGTPETYRKIMGNDLERVLDNIRYLVRRKRDIEGDKSDFWFSYIVMRENLDEIDDFLMRAHDAEVTKVRFMELSPRRKTITGVRRAGLDWQFRHFEQFNRKIQSAFLERLPRVVARARDLGISVEAGSMEPASRLGAPVRIAANQAFRKIFPETNIFPMVHRRGGCMAPWTGQVHIGQDGDVQLCCGTNYSLGNLHEDDFADIWNGPKIRRIRRGFGRGAYPRPCGYCRGIGPDEYPIEAFRDLSRPGQE
jgi:MoaA/NifB/PqqE/SkfB family radical SAM enzyme